MSTGLGLVGCGRAAAEIARVGTAIPNLRVVAAHDPDAGRAADFAARFGIALAPDLDALLGRPDLDAVYVGTPHHLLAPIVERALAAGKHVLAEKPLALEAAEAERLGTLADRMGRKLCVFFELRRSGTVTAAKALVAGGALGAIRQIRIRTLIDKPLSYWGLPGPLNWRARRAEAGGGVVMMNTIHQLDTLRYLTGLDVVRVTGTVATLTAPVEVEDMASATLTLRNGALVSLVANAHAAGADEAETIEIEGTEGQIVLPDPFGRAPVRVYASGDRTWRDVPVERPDSHRLMVESFLEAIATGGPVPAGAADAAAALRIVRALYRASAEGRAVDL